MGAVPLSPLHLRTSPGLHSHTRTYSSLASLVPRKYSYGHYGRSWCSGKGASGHSPAWQLRCQQAFGLAYRLASQAGWPSARSKACKRGNREMSTFKGDFLTNCPIKSGEFLKKENVIHKLDLPKKLNFYKKGE